MKRLHPTQARLLELLARNIDEPLTVRQLQEELNLSSTSLVAHHVEQLEKKGYLKRSPSDPRDYQVLHHPERQVAYLNLYGLAQCGPNGTILDGNPIDRIPIATKLLPFPAAEGFMLQARGKSMEPTIQDGDLLIAQKTSDLRDGMIVACVNDGEAMVKMLRLAGSKQPILQSLNPDYSPFTAADQFRVEGEIVGIFKRTI